MNYLRGMKDDKALPTIEAKVSSHASWSKSLFSFWRLAVICWRKSPSWSRATPMFSAQSKRSPWTLWRWEGSITSTSWSAAILHTSFTRRLLTAAWLITLFLPTLSSLPTSTESLSQETWRGSNLPAEPPLPSGGRSRCCGLQLEPPLSLLRKPKHAPPRPKRSNWSRPERTHLLLRPLAWHST